MKKRVLTAVLAGIVCSMVSAAGDITRDSRIVVDTSNRAEVDAGNDLADYLQRITGRELAVEDHGTPADGRYTIAVGENNFTRELTEQLKALDRDGFIIESEQDRLLIRGYNSRATHFGINYFLQKYCGVRWYLPLPGNLGTVVPNRERIDLDVFTDKQEPSFVIRMFGTGKEWIFRNLGPGRRWHVQHNMHADVFPMSKYYESNPEYYALIGGRREGYPGWSQPCISNPEVVQLFIDAAVQYFNKNPDSYMRPMGLNDGQAYCQCPACLAQGNTSSDRLYTFYDKVVRGLQEKHPGGKVGVLVYAGIRDLPSPEVMERIDLSQLAGGLPWDRTDWFMPEARAAHKKLIRAWSEKLDKFFLWDWFTFRSVSVPTMNIRVLDDMIKFARDLGNCDGLYNQTGPAYVLHGPHMWVYAQLLWDADRDVEELLDDFCNGMFGKGERWMKEYYNLIQEVWWRQESGEVSLWNNYSASLGLFREADMRQLRTYLENARQAADTENARARVDMVADLFHAVDLTWQSSRSAREAVDFIEVTSEEDALRAERTITEVLAGQQALQDHRQRLAEEEAPKHLQEYAPLRWQMDVPWVISALIDYRVRNNQQAQLRAYFTETGASYGEFATGRLLKELGQVADIRSVLAGENLIINPNLEKDGYEPNGLHMYDWTHDDRCPAAWYRWHPDRGTHFFAAEDAEAQGGIAYGIRGEKAHDCYHQILPAEPGDQFVITGRIKPHLVTGSAKALLTVLYWNEEKKWTEGSAAYTIPAGIENDRWYKLIGSVTVPEKARYIVVGLWGRNFGDMGQDWALFDDIHLIRINR